VADAVAPGGPCARRAARRKARDLDGTHKTIWVDGNAQSFDLSDRSAREKPLPADPAIDALRSAWEARTPAGNTSMDMVTLSPDTRSQLRALGYAE
jgi:hypothetical protein